MTQTVRTLLLSSLLAASFVPPAAIANDAPPAPAPATQPGAPKPMLRMGGCKIEEVKPEPCADPKKAQATASGLEKVGMKMPLDPGVAGRWALQPVSGKAQVGGTLEISEGGQFRWLKDGKPVAEGPADEVRPKVGAKSGARYWRVAQGNDEYYFAVEQGAMTLWSAKEHAKVATGKPQQ